jgi:hypothetical protein
MTQSSSSFHLSVEAPVRGACDVIVVGGGTSGTVAAIAAARTGARTVLVEQNGFVGGALLKGAGPLHSFFNLYKAFPGAAKVQVVRGIPSEIIDRLVAIGGCRGHLEQELGYAYDSVATLIDRSLFKYAVQEMLLESGVEILFHTRVIAAFDEPERRGVIIHSKGGIEALAGGMLVDCTGDGDVAALAGASFARLHGDYNVGFPFGMANVDLKRAEGYLREKGMITQIVHAEKEPGGDDVVRIGFDLKKLEVFERYMAPKGLWGPLCYAYHKADLVYINTCTVRAVDGIDCGELSRAQAELRRQAYDMSLLLKKHIPGFEHAYLSWTADQVGVRRTRVIDCDYDITTDDIVEARRFEDEIAVYGFHDMAPRIMIRDGLAYGIPYRALRPRGLDHVLVAGRMITSHHDAHMSTRNTVSCMAQGQGAGTAAALCAAKGMGTRDLEAGLLRDKLLEAGVFLGRVE